MMPIHLDSTLMSENIDGWPHVCGLELSYDNNQKVMLLIGQHFPDALMPIDVGKGQR